MNTEELRTHREYFDMVHTVTIRAIGVLDDADLDFRPKEGMRTVRAILFHMYAAEESLARAVERGALSTEQMMEFVPEEPAGAAAMAKIVTVEDMRRFAQRCHETASAALAKVTDAQLARVVESPLGELIGAYFITFINDEHWHHRGQFYTYLRLLGKEPPMLYGYGE